MGSRLQDPLPDWTTHLALVQSDGLVQTGPKEEVLASLTTSTQGWTPPVHTTQPRVQEQQEEILIDMDNVNVSYGDRKVRRCIITNDL